MKSEEDIRAAAFAEAAELVRNEFSKLPCALLSKKILALGEPKPDPRSRRIEIRVKTLQTKIRVKTLNRTYGSRVYTYDKDALPQANRKWSALSLAREPGTLADGYLLLYALEQEREKLIVREAHLEEFRKTLNVEDAARLEHLNLFLGGRS